MLSNAKGQKKDPATNKVEVRLEGEKAVITLSSFVEGLGWCTQKTMRLDLERLEELEPQLTTVRDSLEQSENKKSNITSNVIAFPFER